MRSLCLRCALLLPSIFAFVLGAEDGLAEAHLAQARIIKATDAPRPQTELRKARQEIEARLKDWDGKLRDRPGEKELLAGISENVLKKAREITENPAAVKELLRQPVSLEMILALVAVRNPDARAAYQNWRAMTRQPPGVWHSNP